MNLEYARSQMIRQQVRAWEVLDGRVLDALQSVPREVFVPAAYRGAAFADLEIPLDHGQAMLAPKIEGRVLQALRIEAADRVLEIGTGSGFLTACLARLSSTVVSVDIFPDFTSAAARNLEHVGTDNVELTTADALELERPDEFDAIAVTGSVPELDDRFIRMLRPGGRLFVVTGRDPVMDAQLITLMSPGSWSRDALFETSLTPLINADKPAPFVL